MKKTAHALEKLFNTYSQAHQHPINRLIHWITIPLVSFSVLGMIWAIPFPYVDFLGAYNGFVNWASFVIAFAIYYYYRLSPVLSYGMLLLVFAYSAGIVSLEKLHVKNSWPEMWQVCLGIFLFSWLAQLAGNKMEIRKFSLKMTVQQWLTGPFWLMYLLFKKTGIYR